MGYFEVGPRAHCEESTHTSVATRDKRGGRDGTRTGDRRIRLDLPRFEGHHVEAVRTTKHLLTKVDAIQQKGSQNRRHSTRKVAREPRSHDFYDVNVALFRLS
jgi:hypothetical protein